MRAAACRDVQREKTCLQDEMHHGAPSSDGRATQRFQLPFKVDDTVVDGMLDDRQLLADGVDEVSGQLG